MGKLLYREPDGRWGVKAAWDKPTVSDGVVDAFLLRQLDEQMQQAVLEWHAQKQSCRTFEIEEYTALSLAIAAYVYPYRRYQETVKEAIYAAESKEELDAIEIDYGSVGAAA